jgi:signal transduction histidine kinase
MTKLPTHRWRHELKNQMGVILGFADLLLQEMPLDDPRRADVEEIGTAAARAMELIKQGSESDAEEI